MFSHDGPARSARKNWILATYLAAIAGFVNSAGLLLVSAFTSHVTGTVGRLAHDVARADLAAAKEAAVLFMLFLLGAFFATHVLEASLFRTRQAAYGAAFLFESLLLGAFVMFPKPFPPLARAGLLCVAMGLQNSLLTLISQARIRTTHLTGVVTDLGIELARWMHRRRPDPDHLSAKTTVLLSSLISSFLVGGVTGTWLTLRYQDRSVLVPALAAFAASLFAFRTGHRRARQAA